MTVAGNICPQRRYVVVSRDGNCFCQAVALRRVETDNEKHKDICQSSSCLFQKNPKVFELPLFAIFNYKYSHCFFNTKIFYCNFFSWSNWLIMEVYCNCTIPFNAVLSSQHISQNHPRCPVKINFLLISLFVYHVCRKQNIFLWV